MMFRSRLLAFVVIGTAFMAVVLPFTWPREGARQASAETGPDYSLAVMGDACHPSSAGADCEIDPLSTFTVSVQLNKINIPVYRAFQVYLTSPSELPYKNRPHTQEIVWPDCEIPYDNPTSPMFYQAGCTVQSRTSTYLGEVLEVDYTCGASSTTIYTITMVQGSNVDATYLVDQDYHFVEPVGGPSKTLTIRCHAVAAEITYGDASCDGTVNSIDAAFILQYSAGLLSSLACAPNADVNGDGGANAVDAALILQYSAGLISQLGPPPTPPSPPPPALAPARPSRS